MSRGVQRLRARARSKAAPALAPRNTLSLPYQVVQRHADQDRNRVERAQRGGRDREPASVDAARIKLPAHNAVHEAALEDERGAHLGVDRLEDHGRQAER